LYDEVVSTYIRVLEHDNPAAAAAVTQILSIHGSRAALRATLVITLLKMDVEKNHTVENLDVQMHLMKDFPEALALLEGAITACLKAWGIAYGESAEPEIRKPCCIENESTPSTSMPPPI
jgi:hypothetical protein